MKKKKIFLTACILTGLLLLAFCCCGFTWDNASISEFEGTYLCDVEEPDEYGSIETLTLSFNDEGNLMREDALTHGTLGSTSFRDYTEYKIDGNTLTCKYDGLYSYYSTYSYSYLYDTTGGTDVYVLNDEGNLEAEGHIWYRHTPDSASLATEPGVLMRVTDTDFPEGSFSESAPFLGNTRLRRRDVEQVIFLSSLEEKPDGAWDVSENQDGSVYAWTDQSEGFLCVYIAAEGGVTAESTSNLFRYCVNLKSIDFNDSFHVTSRYSMAYMFAECHSLTALDLTDFVETSVINMKKMFYNCSSLTELYLTESMFSDAIEANYTDMFTGTKWEGSSPLLDGDSSGLTVSYLLDTRIINNDMALSVRIYQAYDDKLKETIEYGGSADGLMYAVSDLEGNSIPELVIRTENNGQYYYTSYTFCAESCQICSFSISEDKLVELALHYRYIDRECVSSMKSDIDGDGEKEEIDIYVLRDEEDIDFLKIYVDSKGAYSMDVEGAYGNSTDIDANAYSAPNGNGFLYLRIYSGNRGEYCGLLGYESDRFSEMLNYSDLIRNLQWKDKLQRGYFEVETELTENSNLQLSFTFDSLTLGEGFSFTAEYLCAAGSCEQRGWLSDINAQQYSFYTLSDNCEFFQYPGSTDTAFCLGKGQTVYPDKVWLNDGYLWLHVKDSEGREGWLPMCTAPFVEVSYSPESDSGKYAEQNEEYLDQYYNLEDPSETELRYYGDCKYNEGDSKSATIYYQYAQAINGDSADTENEIEKTESKEETEKENEKTTGNGDYESVSNSGDSKIQELVQAFEARMTEGFLQEYSGLKKPLSYCAFDWDKDGFDEYILRRVLPDESSLQQWLVDYDPASDTWEAKELTFTETPDNDTLYFWEERRAIVLEDPSGNGAFLTYSLSDIDYLFTAYCDMTYLPKLEFQVIDEGNGIGMSDVAVIWKNEENLEVRQNIYIRAIREGEENIWTDYDELAAAFCDLDGDGNQKMIMRGEQYGLLYAVYYYNESTGDVFRVGTIDGYNNVYGYYSLQYHAIVICGHNSTVNDACDWYIFHPVTKSGFEDEFQVTLKYDYVEEEESIYLTKNGEATLLSEVNYTNDDLTKWDAICDSYLGDLVEMEFKALDEIPSVDPEAVVEKSDDSADAAEFEFPEQDLIPYILAWKDMSDAWEQTSDAGTRACTLSLENKETFWNFLRNYVIYETGYSDQHQSGGMASYYRTELKRIVYTAFPKYDGEFPDVPESYGIDVFGELYSFSLATPEEYTCEFQSVTAEENGEIEAEYIYTMTAYGYEDAESSDTYRIRISLTDDSDPQKEMGVSYRITGLTCISGNKDSVSSDNEDYILPESNVRYLDYEDVEGLSLREVNYAKNEIYARAGRKFNSQELMDYFSSKAWYNGIYEPSEFDADIGAHLNEYETANAEFLSMVEYGMDPDGYQLY